MHSQQFLLKKSDNIIPQLNFTATKYTSELLGITCFCRTDGRWTSVITFHWRFHKCGSYSNENLSCRLATISLISMYILSQLT